MCHPIVIWPVPGRLLPLFCSSLRVRGLLDGDGLGKVAGEVNVKTLENG